MRYLKLVSALVLFSILSSVNACGKHPWFRQVPTEMVGEFYASPIQYASFAEISESRAREAFDLLKSADFSPVSPKKAEFLTGRSEDEWGGGSLFLVRGLRYSTSNGMLKVYANHNGVLVHFVFLGDPGKGPLPAPLVVKLAHPPPMVFMLCTGSN